MAVFQTTLVFSSQVVGRPVELERPGPCGPRNWVQESSATAGRERVRKASNSVRMGWVSREAFRRLAAVRRTAAKPIVSRDPGAGPYFFFPPFSAALAHES